MDPVLTEWRIGLENWVLQDGNYTDFVGGQKRQFALELGYARSARLRDSGSTERAVRYAGRGDWYVVCGELLRDSPEPMERGFVLDFRLKAYDNWIVLDDLEPPAAGTWLEGEITLSVDPFEYMDRLAMQEGMPPLIYTWQILAIEMDVSPRICPSTSALAKDVQFAPEWAESTLEAGRTAANCTSLEGAVSSPAAAARSWSVRRGGR